MTEETFLAYKYTLYDKAVELSGKIIDDSKLGRKSVESDMLKLQALLLYIDIMNDYDLYTEAEEDINMFDRETMLIISDHINDICKTGYNIDFILTTE